MIEPVDSSVEIEEGEDTLAAVCTCACSCQEAVTDDDRVGPVGVDKLASATDAKTANQYDING